MELTALQGTFMPKVLAAGYTHDCLMGFVANTAGGNTLDAGCSQLEAEHAKKALRMVHSCNILHQDIHLANFLRAPQYSSGAVWMIDFSLSVYIPSLCQAWKENELLKLDECLQRAQVS